MRLHALLESFAHDFQQMRCLNPKEELLNAISILICAREDNFRFAAQTIGIGKSQKRRIGKQVDPGQCRALLTTPSKLMQMRQSIEHQFGISNGQRQKKIIPADAETLQSIAIGRLSQSEGMHDAERSPSRSRVDDVLHNISGMGINCDHVHHFLPVRLGQLCPCHLNQPSELLDLELIVHLQQQCRHQDQSFVTACDYQHAAAFAAQLQHLDALPEIPAAFKMPYSILRHARHLIDCCQHQLLHEDTQTEFQPSLARSNLFRLAGSSIHWHLQQF